MNRVPFASLSQPNRNRSLLYNKAQQAAQTPLPATVENLNILPASTMELHDDAKHLASSVADIRDHMSKASHVLIAVERHDKDSAGWHALEPKDRFLWIKGRTVSQVSLLKPDFTDTLFCF